MMQLQDAAWAPDSCAKGSEKPVMRPLLEGIGNLVVAMQPCCMIELQDVLDDKMNQALAGTHASCLKEADVKVFVPGQGLDFYPGHAVKKATVDVPDNTKLSRTAAQMLSDPSLPAVWREFIEANCSQGALDALLHIFGKSILVEHPGFEERFGPLSGLRAKIRGIGVPEPGDVEMDVLVGVQSAVHGGPCVQRGPHVKRPDKIFEAYLYFREDGDTNEDGDHEFFVSAGASQPAFGAGWQTDPAGVRLVHSVPTRHNSYVAWINSSRSIQQVGPRGPTPYPLPYVEFLVQMPAQIFEVPLLPGWDFHSAKMPSPLSGQTTVCVAGGIEVGTCRAGWHLQEEDAKGPFRWTGPAADSFLELPWTGHEDAVLRVPVRHSLAPEVVDAAEVRVNGERIPMRRTKAHGTTHLEGVVPAAVLARETGFARVHFHVEKPQRPCDVHEGQTDTRRVGLGIGTVLLLPSSIIAEEAAAGKAGKAAGSKGDSSNPKKMKRKTGFMRGLKGSLRKLFGLGR